MLLLSSFVDFQFECIPELDAIFLNNICCGVCRGFCFWEICFRIYLGFDSLIVLLLEFIKESLKVFYEK